MPSVTGSSPKIRSLPSLTGETQPIIRIVDDLPAPFGPRKPNDSPRSTSTSMPSTATKSPKRFTSCSALMSGDARSGDMRVSTLPAVAVGGREGFGTSASHGPDGTPPARFEVELLADWSRDATCAANVGGDAAAFASELAFTRRVVGQRDVRTGRRPSRAVRTRPVRQSRDGSRSERPTLRPRGRPVRGAVRIGRCAAGRGGDRGDPRFGGDPAAHCSRLRHRRHDVGPASNARRHRRTSVARPHDPYPVGEPRAAPGLAGDLGARMGPSRPRRTARRATHSLESRRWSTAMGW